ncbi:MAG: hypothetical protein NC218_08500 [Acetobacter sp.]|nr:hypothetical protein [Acetobacter sp.]
MVELFKADELRKHIYPNKSGLLFCFGTSFISKIIQAKTRQHSYEQVPSHVAVVFNNYIYESTTEIVKINKKTIPSGVRRWLITDYLKSEKKKDTSYFFYPFIISLDTAESFVHYPYGKDIILDYLLQDGSDGSKYGLICSQYANKVIGSPIKQEVVSPAELFRWALSDSKDREMKGYTN